MKQYSVSVRNLVEFVLRKGDMTSGAFSPNRMEEGRKVHEKLQGMQGRYLDTEVSLGMTIAQESIDLTISGRADGLFMKEEIYIIDEIKSTMSGQNEVVENPLHLAQGKCYAYFFLKKEQLATIGVRLTYVSLLDESITTFDHQYDEEELSDFVRAIAQTYCRFLLFLEDLKSKRDLSITQLTFPFSVYRSGQRKFVSDVYRAIRDKKRLFVKAPTGTGKTISTLFPAIKSLIYEDNDKIFYLTAKGTNKTAVEETLGRLEEQGLVLRSIFLTAKEKICPYGKCEMDQCVYAKGYYDRIRGAISDILENQRTIKAETVLQYSESHQVCPFEFSLEIALFSDLVVCDYNYAFDPSAYLRRFFNEQQGRYIFLLDEAHNFIERVREMFSATIEKEDFLTLRREINKEFETGPYIPQTFHDLIKELGKINGEFLRLRQEEEGAYVLEESPRKMFRYLTRLKEISEMCFAEDFQIRQYGFYHTLLEVYFSVYHFCRIGEVLDSSYRSIIYQKDKKMRVKLFCLDPSARIAEDMRRCTSLIAFSATLTPASYYVEMMGGEDAVYLMLPSPFDKERLKVLIHRGISGKYKDRHSGLATLAEGIYTAISVKTGNYMVFFPSYEYMMAEHEVFTEMYPHLSTMMQDRNMTEIQREEFLSAFQENPPDGLVAFVVLGGTFAEAIDLRGERLSGAIIVSLGLPGLSLELDLIRDYFDRQGKDGFDYAYGYLAMNKVMQGGGRVIRTANDKGFILLMDHRFLDPRRQRLLPKEWTHYEVVARTEQIRMKLEKFWED